MASVFPGGEPTLAPELPEFLSRIRELGYDVKLDTNGSRPSVVKNLAAADLINKVAHGYQGLSFQLSCAYRCTC